MAIEVANALHRRVARGELSVATAARLVENLLTSGVELLNAPALLPRTLELSVQLGQGAIYDSYYLALAEALGCELWDRGREILSRGRTLCPKRSSARGIRCPGITIETSPNSPYASAMLMRR